MEDVHALCIHIGAFNQRFIEAKMREGKKKEKKTFYHFIFSFSHSFILISDEESRAAAQLEPAGTQQVRRDSLHMSIPGLKGWIDYRGSWGPLLQDLIIFIYFFCFINLQVECQVKEDGLPPVSPL